MSSSPKEFCLRLNDILSFNNPNAFKQLRLSGVYTYMPALRAEGCRVDELICLIL